MNQSRHNGAMARNRSEVAKLIVAAVVLTVGVNLLTAPLLSNFTLTGLLVSLAGAALVLAALAFTSLQALKSAGYQRRLRAVIATEGDSRTPVAIDGYDFSEQTTQFLQSLFAESQNFKRIWKGQDKNPNMPSMPDKKMVSELSEYYFLSILSLHLSEVFNGVDETRVMTLERGDIPDILLTNRFLETFSRDMSSRDVFGEHFISPEGRPENSKVVAAYGKGGAYFDLFHLTLPKGSKVSRDRAGKLEITTKKFVLSWKSEFYGFYGSTPRGFEPLYLGVDFDEFDKRMIEIEIVLRYKVSAIFSVFGWDYFDWVESFLDKIERKISFDDFIRDSGWKIAYTINKVRSSDNGLRPTYLSVGRSKGKDRKLRSMPIQRKSKKT